MLEPADVCGVEWGYLDIEMVFCFGDVWFSQLPLTISYTSIQGCIGLQKLWLCEVEIM